MGPKTKKGMSPWNIPFLSESTLLGKHLLFKFDLYNIVVENLTFLEH